MRIRLPAGGAIAVAVLLAGGGVQPRDAVPGAQGGARSVLPPMTRQAPDERRTGDGAALLQGTPACATNQGFDEVTASAAMRAACRILRLRLNQTVSLADGGTGAGPVPDRCRTGAGAAL